MSYPRKSSRSLHYYANIENSGSENENENEDDREDSVYDSKSVNTQGEEEKLLREREREREEEEERERQLHLADSPRHWPKKVKMRNLLLYSFASFLVSIAQSIILPSIQDIGTDLGGDERAVALTMTLPLLVLGLMNMLISPFSDTYGRKLFHVSGLLIFTAGSLAGGFVQDIYFFLACRIIQGFGGAAPSIVGAGAISDMFDIEQRGQALGLFLLGPMIGPVLGPLFGGLLASANLGENFQNWRLIFYVVGGIGTLLTLLTLVVMKESWRKDPTKSYSCPNPFGPLVYLKYMRITFLIIALSVGFAGFFAVNITFPKILADNYGYDPLIIGLCYLPFGAGLILGTGIGGRSADRIRKKGGTPEHRLIPSLLFFPLNAVGIIGQGWVFESKLSVAAVLGISFFLGLTFILPRPGTNTYAIEKLKVLTQRDVASSATGLIFGVMLPVGALIAQLSVEGINSLGYGVYFTIVAGGLLVATIPIIIFTLADIKKSKQRARGDTSRPDPSDPVRYESVN